MTEQEIRKAFDEYPEPSMEAYAAFKAGYEAGQQAQPPEEKNDE